MGKPSRRLCGALALLLCTQGCVTSYRATRTEALQPGSRVWVGVYSTRDGARHECHCWASLVGPDTVRLEWDGGAATPPREVPRADLWLFEGTHIEAGPTIAAWAVVAAVVGTVVLIRNSSPASCSYNPGDCFK